jgi:4-phytase/acid phosphatase
MALHDAQAQMIWRAPYVATHNGALTARAVLAALQGGEALPDPAAKGAKLTIISGHDTNLCNMAGVLGVRWSLPGQPDTTPPDGTLAFEVWRNPKSGERLVRVAMIYPSLEDLRSGAALSPAHPAGRVEVPVPGCADGPGGECRLKTFVSLIGSRLPAECVLKP